MTSPSENLKNRAHELGFALAGVTAVAMPPHFQHFVRWLERGFHGEMQYLESRQAAYQHPDSILQGCRSILMLGFPYDLRTLPSESSNTSADDSPTGKIARYASGEQDYHDVIHKRLQQLKHWMEERHPGSSNRGIVDTAPLLEREFAAAAGLGWIGKNTLLLNRQWGSYFFLAALLTDVELAPDEPAPHSYCGTCTACLDACPTRAFPEPFVLDARKCISYATIEQRGVIDSHIAERLEGWVFGCDICQEVCPWNQKRERDESIDSPDTDAFYEANQVRNVLANMPLREILKLDDQEFRQRFRKTPLWRSRRSGLIRNAILLLVNQRTVEAVQDLIALLDDEESLLNVTAAWAVVRLTGQDHVAEIQASIERHTCAETKQAMQDAIQRATK